MENKWNLRMMSPEQLLKQKLTEPTMLNRGLKKRFPDEDSADIVNRLQDDLLKMIGYERVERKVARSQAEYNAMTGLVVVTKKLGKWNTYGYRAHNLNCLHYYETLYLIDINRLELYYDAVLVSLEQAYTLMLNNKNDRKTHEKYFIYSNLSKAGYIVQPHHDHIPNLDIPQFSNTKEISMADKCVWQCLYEKLKQTTSSDDNNHQADELYAKIKQNMTLIGEAIRNQSISTVMKVDEGIDDELGNWKNVAVKTTAKDCSRKRKIDWNAIPSTSKNIQRSEFTTDRFLDVLTHEQDVVNFKTIFRDIQVIELESLSCENVDDICLEFDFDLYLPQSGFKQTNPGPPNYRILIFKSNEPPATRELICKSFLKPASPAPVLVFYVNEFMRINAFLYRISL